MEQRWVKGLLRTAAQPFMVLCSGAAAGFAAVQPALIRPSLFALAAAGMVALSDKYPHDVVIALFAFLPFLGFVRRVLIPVAGWSGADPLILMSHICVLCLAATWVVRRPNATIMTSAGKAVTLFVLIAAVQTANPLQGNPMVGIAGGLVMIAPVLWFYVGNNIGTERLFEKLFTLIQVVGIITSLYGLYQNFFGLLPFEELWLEITQINSMFIAYGEPRAMSTFVVGMEYALFTNVVCVITIVRGLTRNRWHFLMLAIHLPALFLESSRGPLVLLLLASAVIGALMAPTPVRGALRFAGTILTLVVLLLSCLKIMSGAIPPGPLGNAIAHQVNGLLNPTDDEHSTANLHASMFWEGIRRGIKNPFGRGTGAITHAAEAFGHGSVNWEVDLSDAFFALGAIGGLVYLWVLVTNVSSTLKLAFTTKHPVFLSGAVIILVAGGQWWNGGLYVTTPLVWLMLGFINRASMTDGMPRELSQLQA